MAPAPFHLSRAFKLSALRRTSREFSRSSWTASTRTTSAPSWMQKASRYGPDTIALSR